MTPGELLLLLYDELVKRATMASIALDKGQFDAFEAAVDRCTDIVNYLDETLDSEKVPRRSFSLLSTSANCRMGSCRMAREAAPRHGGTSSGTSIKALY